MGRRASGRPRTSAPSGCGSSAGFEAQQIAFRGVEALTEIIGGRVDFSVQPFQTTLALIRDGKLVALAISANKRVAALPDVPTTIEAGLPPDSVYPFYTGIYLPAKTPPNIVEQAARRNCQGSAGARR